MKFLFLLVMFGIQSVVAKHLKMSFRNVNNQSLYEIERREFLCHKFLIFMPFVMEGNEITIIVIDARRSNNRTTKIASDVLNGLIRSTRIGFGTNIKSIGVFCIHFVFHFFERNTKTMGETIE